MSVKVNTVEYITSDKDSWLDVTIKVEFSEDGYLQGELSRVTEEVSRIPLIVSKIDYNLYLKERESEEIELFDESHFVPVVNKDGTDTEFIEYCPPESAFSRLLKKSLNKEDYVILNCENWLHYDENTNEYIYRDYITKTPAVLGAIKELEDIRDGKPCSNYRFELDSYVFNLLSFLHSYWD